MLIPCVRFTKWLRVRASVPDIDLEAAIPHLIDE